MPACAESLALVGLDFDEIGNASPFELSGGQQRRVAFAGVLAMRRASSCSTSRVAGLDPAARRDFLTLIAGLHAQGRTVVMISHSMDNLAALCDRVLVLNEGRHVRGRHPRRRVPARRRAERHRPRRTRRPAHGERPARAGPAPARGRPARRVSSLAATLTGLAGGTSAQPARFGGAGGTRCNAFSFGSYYPGEEPAAPPGPARKAALGLRLHRRRALRPQRGRARGGGRVRAPVGFYLASRIPLGYAARSLAPLLFIVVVASLLNLFVEQEGAVLVEWAFIRITAGGVGACLFIAARLRAHPAGHEPHSP